MATLLATQPTTKAGLEAVYTAALLAGHVFDNQGQDVVLHIKNASAGAITVAVGAAATVDGRTLDPLSVSVPAGEERFVGPFRNTNYAAYEAETGLKYGVLVVPSSAASVSYAAIRISDI